MSTEKSQRLPTTDEVHALAAAQHGVEHLAGTVLLDRYRLISLHGTGGASVVYRAEHAIMHKPVAVKILRPELAVRQDFVRRFLAEARTVARLRHENIVDIVDVGRTETGIVFCVMEYLEGEELAATLERDGPMPWARARDIVMQVCRALAAAHAAGVVHRDVKPQNCFRIRHGNNPDFIKLLDFGIAKQTDNDQGLTATGVVMGTAEYMSPEQARGRDVDGRADIYSVGAMLFELLAGRPPFEGETFLDVLLKHSTEPAPRLSTLVSGVDPAIDALVARTLAKKPQDRFASVEQLMSALAANTGHSFHGLLDSALLTGRPESVLPRASSSHQVVGALRRLDRGSLAAIGIGAVLASVAIAFAVRAGSSSSDEATRGVAEVEVGKTDDELRHAASPSDERGVDARRDGTVELEPPPVVTPEPRVEPAPSPPPRAAAVAPTPAPHPAEAEESKATIPRSPPSKDKETLKRRILVACERFVKTDQRLTVKIDKAGSYRVSSPPDYKLLASCVDSGIGVAGLAPGTYPILLPKPAGPPPAPDPARSSKRKPTPSPFGEDPAR